MLTEHLSPAVSRERSQQQISVLLVDDDDQYAAYVRSVFDETTSLLVDLRHIRYLRDIQHALQSKAFSVVLLDVNLPDGNGLNWLQGHHEQVQAAVVVLTGNPDYSSRDD